MPRRISLVNEAGQDDLSNIVNLRSIRGRCYVDCVVDTGSPLTVIPYQKAVELNLPVKDMIAEEDIRLLGTKHRVYRFSKSIQFSFLCDDGSFLSLESYPLIAKPLSIDSESWVLTELILGLDFLREHGFKLFCDMKNDEAYLEEN